VERQAEWASRDKQATEETLERQALLALQVRLQFSFIIVVLILQIVVLSAMHKITFVCSNFRRFYLALQIKCFVVLGCWLF